MDIVKGIVVGLLLACATYVALFTPVLYNLFRQEVVMEPTILIVVFVIEIALFAAGRAKGLF